MCEVSKGYEILWETHIFENSSLVIGCVALSNMPVCK